MQLCSLAGPAAGTRVVTAAGHLWGALSQGGRKGAVSNGTLLNYTAQRARKGPLQNAAMNREAEAVFI